MLKTLGEQFAPLLAGRYRGQPEILWRQLDGAWRGTTLTDEELDLLLAEYAPAHEVRRDGQGWTVIHTIYQDLLGALETRDWAAMLIIADRAEEAGVRPDLCDLTRQALRVQYPTLLD